MNINYQKVERLQKGETIIAKEKGNSMVPLIYSGQPHKVEPATWEDVTKDHIVFCKVHGRFYTHLVKATDPKRGVQIGNNKGRINGWTKQVYGKVIEILPL